MMDIEKIFLLNLTQLSFTLAVLIVMHHSFNVDVHYNAFHNVFDITYIVERYFYNVSEYSVPMFFFISAYLFYRTYTGDWLGYKNKINKRIYSLVIPYVLYNSFGYVKHVLKTNGKIDLYGLIDAIVSASTMPLWFIRELIIFSFLSYFLYFVIHRINYAVLISVVASIMSIYGIVSYRSFIYWIPVYLMGGIFSRKDIQIKFIDIIYNKKLAFFSFFILITVPWFLPNYSYSYDNIMRLEYYAFRILCVPLILMIYFNIPLFKCRNFMKYSFFLYCAHFPIIISCKIVFERILGDFLLLEYFATVFFTIAIVIMFSRFCSLKYPFIWKILNGWRK